MNGFKHFTSGKVCVMSGKEEENCLKLNTLSFQNDIFQNKN